MNYLEELIRQYYEWKECVVKTNIKVGKRAQGGYQGELDVVVYDPKKELIIHFEPSTDAASWRDREPKYQRKFALGREYIRSVVFPWLPKDIPLEQIAVFFNVENGQCDFLGGKAMSIDYLVGQIRDDIAKKGRVGKNAIPENFNILRTIQLVICGYRKPVHAEDKS